jgi:hypothetical protein
MFSGSMTLDNGNLQVQVRQTPRAVDLVDLVADNDGIIDYYLSVIILYQGFN